MICSAGRVWRFSKKLAGRVGSGHKMFDFLTDRAGSGSGSGDFQSRGSGWITLARPDAPSVTRVVVKNLGKYGGRDACYDDR